jgi:tetrapyrrole methylase family protein / MazG family protein
MPERFKKLKELAAFLRGPEGCPWDKKQTIKSMLKNISDEAKEVEDAINNEDHENLKEELGDLLFNVIMIAQIAEEEGHFTISEVLSDIEKKILTRHSWVFGEDKAKTPEEAIELWNKNKGNK